MKIRTNYIGFRRGWYNLSRKDIPAARQAICDILKIKVSNRACFYDYVNGKKIVKATMIEPLEEMFESFNITKNEIWGK